MPEVLIKTGVDLEKGLRKFRRLCDKERIMEECTQRRYYIKPSEKRRMRGKR